MRTRSEGILLLLALFLPVAHPAAGAAMYDPLAVGVAIDSTLVEAPLLHVDVETKGEFTRGETVANRNGRDELSVLQHFADGDHYVILGFEPLKANVKVCTKVDAERFVTMLLGRIQGK